MVTGTKLHHDFCKKKEGIYFLMANSFDTFLQHEGKFCSKSKTPSFLFQDNVVEDQQNVKSVDVRRDLDGLEKKKYMDVFSSIPLIDDYKYQLARSLLKEACIESVCTGTFIFFTPSGKKFDEAEKIIGEIFRINPWHSNFGCLYVRTQIYKSRMDTVNAKDILMSCETSFSHQKKSTKVEILVALGLLFCELYLVTHDRNYYLKALRNLGNELHIKAAFLLRCSIRFGEYEFSFDHCVTPYVAWRNEIKLSRLLMLKEFNCLDDQTAEVLNCLAVIQWMIFVRMGELQEDKVIKWDEWTSDFPKNSFFMERLTVQKDFGRLKQSNIYSKDDEDYKQGCFEWC